MSPERKRRPIPEWAQREREGDLQWIQENLFLIWPTVKQAYQSQGRGAVLVDTLTRVQHAHGEGNPVFYMTEQAIEQSEQHPEALGMVRAYDPEWEMVMVLLKKGRESTYRVGVPEARSTAQLPRQE